MTERTIRLVAGMFAAAGVAITTYLLVARLTDSALVCTTGGCETVQSSRYAEVLGIPVAALGLVLFLGLLASAVARGEWARLIGATRHSRPSSSARTSSSSRSPFWAPSASGASRPTS